MLMLTRASGVLILLLLSCDPTGPSCTQTVDIHVTSGPTPTISWVPTCPVDQLTVAEDQGPSVWVLRMVSDLRPPVTYGVVPRGARETHPLVHLVAERTYVVYLQVPSSEDRTTIVGMTTFVHRP